jgi:hypothetical protein
MKWIGALGWLLVGCVANVGAPPVADDRGDRASDIADRDDSYGDRGDDSYDEPRDDPRDDDAWDYGGDGDADTDADADGDDFYDEPRDPNCDAQVCDPYEQCGCPAGEACMFDMNDQPSCGTEGSGLEWDSCGQTGCVAGLLCLGASDQDATCYAMCDDAHPCPRGEECLVPIANANGQVITTVCAVSGCSLVNDDCPGSQSCIAYGPDTTICAAPGATRVDATCQYAEECVAGASCIGWEGENEAHCLAHCDSNYDSCPGGHQCVPISANGDGVCAIL